MLALGGATAVWATHESATEEHVFDPPPMTTVITVVQDPPPVTITDEDPIEHPPTTTEPEPPAGGTTITRLNQSWVCTQPISQLATNGLPLRVNLTYDRPQASTQGNLAALQLATGCAGDGNPATVDLVVNVEGDGRTFGPTDDAMRINNALPGARDLVVSGELNCGPAAAGAHQDGVQILGGTNVTFRDLDVGDYDGEEATCQGAGGAMFYSLASQNVDVEGGSYIACNHALLAGASSPGASVTNARFRTAGDPVCVQAAQFSTSIPCDLQSGWGGTVAGLTCQRLEGGAWVNRPPQ